ncbi:MAG: AraC family transcriptional regulator [Haliscomenobacteraceae bacterium CHB4]|nr:AraC family transcriptional regulator [Haliscomenobacteraceae bacterium CHB4]
MVFHKASIFGHEPIYTRILVICELPWLIILIFNDTEVQIFANYFPLGITDNESNRAPRALTVQVFIREFQLLPQTNLPMLNIYDFICSHSKYANQLQFGNPENLFIEYVCPLKEMKVRVWSHKNLLVYPLQGTKGYAATDQYYQSRVQQFFFIRKGGFISHQYFEQPYRAMMFMFDDAAIKQFLTEFSILAPAGRYTATDFARQQVVTELKSSSFIEAVFMSSLDYLKDPGLESRISLEIKFKELIVNILREKDSNAFSAYLSWICNDTDAAFIKLMRENSHFNFSSPELARIACMSLSTFKREFIRLFGMPPGKWLREQRIARAVAMLSNSNKTISEIAFELGYSDIASFSKAFKLATSFNPTDYPQRSPNRPK